MKSIYSLLVVLVCCAGPAAAAERVKFTVVAEAFTEQSVMGSVYHSATPSKSKTVCRQPPYSSRVECETVTEPGTSAYTTESVDHIVRSGSIVGNGHVYKVSCAANWSGSNCASLIAGSSYPAEIDNRVEIDTMWISYRSGRKLIQAKYDVTAVTAIVQASARAPVQVQAPAGAAPVNVQHPANWSTMNFTEQAAWQERRITELEAAVKTLQASEKTQASWALPHPANWNTMNAAEQAAWVAAPTATCPAGWPARLCSNTVPTPQPATTQIEQPSIGAQRFEPAGQDNTLGPGTQTCGTWTAGVSAKARVDGTPEMFFQVGRIAWVQGFVSGADWQFAGRLAFVDANGLEKWIDNYCGQHPLENIADAATQLVLELERRSK